MITGPAALPLASLPPPPSFRFIFALSQSPWIRLSRSLEQAKENYTDLADTPFPFSFGAFLPLPLFASPILRLPIRLNFFGCSNLLTVNLHLHT